MCKANTKRGGCLCIKHTQKYGVLFVYQARHKVRGLFVYQAHTKVGVFVCVSSTHKGRVFCLCIKHTQG